MVMSHLNVRHMTWGCRRKNNKKGHNTSDAIQQKQPQLLNLLSKYLQETAIACPVPQHLTPLPHHVKNAKWTRLNEAPGSGNCIIVKVIQVITVDTAAEDRYCSRHRLEDLWKIGRHTSPIVRLKDTNQAIL